MPQPSMDDFVALSAILTGIPESVLSPRLDSVNLKQMFLDTLVRKTSPEAVNELLARYRELKQAGKTDQEIGTAILEEPKAPLAMMARNTIKMWYLGAWYPEKAGAPYEIISSQAYTGSFVWSVMQAHPMGFSQFAFGDWSRSPPSLSSFLGGGSGGKP